MLFQRVRFFVVMSWMLPLVIALSACGGGKKAANPDVVALQDLGAEFTFDEQDNPLTVSLKGPKITDASMAHLRPLSSLTRIIFSGAAITDRGIENLAALSKLENLGFANTGLTDNGLKHLSKLPLTVLLLYKADITDAGLEHIKSIKSLKSLNIKGTKVTAAAVEALKQALPNCRVMY